MAQPVDLLYLTPIPGEIGPASEYPYAFDCHDCGQRVPIGSIPLGQLVMRHVDRLILAHRNEHATPPAETGTNQEDRT